jgi:hypothetical protein
MTFPVIAGHLPDPRARKGDRASLKPNFSKRR